MSEQNEKKRETITLYVSGNGSDSASVQQVLDELASMDDAALEEAHGTITDMLDLLDAPQEESGQVVSEHDTDVYLALEKLAELLSEIRLYNKVQKMDPIESALISRQLGI